jgi:hypothetical protein
MILIISHINYHVEGLIRQFISFSVKNLYYFLIYIILYLILSNKIRMVNFKLKLLD